MEELLKSYVEESLYLLNSCGYEDIPIKNISINNRLRSTFGLYYPSSCEIQISGNHIKYSSKESVINTIIHELIHCIRDEQYKDCIITTYNKKSDEDHDDKWFEIANDISDKLHIELDKYSSIDNYKLYINNMNRDKTNYTSLKVPTYYYLLKCNCGYFKEKISEEENFELVKKGKCPCCNSRNWNLIRKSCYGYKLKKVYK